MTLNLKNTWDNYPPKLTVDLGEYLSARDTIMNKHINVMTFKDIISLVFYAMEDIKENNKNIFDQTEPINYNISNQNEMINQNSQIKKWIELFDEFTTTLKIQNNKRWPKLNHIRNNFRKRLEIFSSASYHPSRNILMLLLRLLYVETYKISNISVADDYYDILGHRISTSDRYSPDKITMSRLFEILKMHLQHYMRIYHNEMIYENILCKSIIDQL